MSNIDRALGLISYKYPKLPNDQFQDPICFEDFLEMITRRPAVLRNVYQVFHDMICDNLNCNGYMFEDYAKTIKYIDYDCSNLFVKNFDDPFFTDWLFANRLMSCADKIKLTSDKNKIYVFEGPPSSGKSTFFNNMLMKLEDYMNSEAGTRYEILWRLERRALARINETQVKAFMDRLSTLLDEYELGQTELMEMKSSLQRSGDFVEIRCPNHCHPILIIPKDYRRAFFDDLLRNDEFKWKMFTQKEYKWIFKDNPCTICSSIYNTLLKLLINSSEILKMLFAQPYRINRRTSDGISVFNPGDNPTKKIIHTNELLQRKLDMLLGDSNQVQYLYSRYAKINNGVYALTDIQSYNVDRLFEIYNIVSNGIHKVEDIEEKLNSLFLVQMNIGDENNIEDQLMSSDRIERISIPYLLDYNMELNYYKHYIGNNIDQCYEPDVLNAFAKIIISSRLNNNSEELKEWIEEPSQYILHCDENLILLKIEIYSGNIPHWLSDEDRQKLTERRLHKIIAESETEGMQGISGRDALELFKAFHGNYANKDCLISIKMLGEFFSSYGELYEMIPVGIMDVIFANDN